MSDNNEKMWGVEGANGELVTVITGEIEMTTKFEAEVNAMNLTQAFGRPFTAVYLK